MIPPPSWVTGADCQSAIESAQNDNALVTMELQVSQARQQVSFSKLFSSASSGTSGGLNVNEVEQLLVQSPAQACLQSPGIGVRDEWALLKLLDCRAWKHGSLQAGFAGHGAFGLRCRQS